MKFFLFSFVILCTTLYAEGEKVPLEKAVQFIYTNYKGETAIRKVIPENLYFGSTEWHPESQWLLKAYDLEKQEYRDFAVKDISSWQTALFIPEE